MSLYNILHGETRSSDVALAMLGVSRDFFQRYRDAWIEKTRIVVLCRTGGGNREDYPNTEAVKHGLYIADEDDDFDHTYAYYYYHIPDQYREAVRDLAIEHENMKQKTDRTLAEMEHTDIESNPKYRPLVDLIKRLTEEGEKNE